MSVIPGLARTEEQRALAHSVARLLADAAPLEAVRAAYGAAVPWQAEVWKALADLGVVGALVPATHGGLGLRPVDLVGVLEATGRAAYAGPLLSTVAAVTTLEPSGDDLLAEVAAGEAVVAVAFDPPVEVRGGKQTRVSGLVGEVLDAPGADVLLLVVGGQGLLVRRDDSVSVEHTVTVDGSRSFGRVRLDAAPARAVDVDAERARAVSVAAWCADGFGAAAAAFELAMAHAQARRQFDRAIGSFQAVQHLLVDAFTALRLAGLAAREALAEPTQAAVAQAYCADGLVRVGATTVQVLGGLGYTWESDAHLFLKRLMSLQTAYGGSTAALDRLAEAVVDVQPPSA